MDNTRKENQRVTLTKRLLKDALLKLLQKKSLAKINVSELCREAGINRATFYKHYEIPQDILVEIGNDIGTNLRAILEESRPDNNFEKSMERICTYFYEQSSLMKILFHSNINITFTDISEQLTESLWNSNAAFYKQLPIDEESIRLIISFLSSGWYFLIRQWLIEDIPKSPKEIASLILSILNKNILEVHA